MKTREIVRRGEPELELVSGPDASLLEARKLVEDAMRAAPDRKLAGAVATLGTLVRRREYEEDEGRLQLHAYVAQLRRYPADVALEALSLWPSQSEFWPSWFELEQICERLVLRRRQILAALDHAADRIGLNSPDPDYREDVSDGLAALARRLRGQPPAQSQSTRMSASERSRRHAEAIAALKRSASEDQ